MTPPVIGKDPALIRPFILRKIRKNLLGQAKGHGMLRHSREEIYARGLEDLAAIRDFLADKKFMMGNEPTSLDACAYGFLEVVRTSSYDNVYKSFVLENKNLSNYCENFKSSYFSS